MPDSDNKRWLGNRFYEMPEAVGKEFIIWHGSTAFEAWTDVLFVRARGGAVGNVETLRSRLATNYKTLKSLKPGGLTFSLVNSAANLKGAEQSLSQFIGWSIDGYATWVGVRPFLAGIGGPLGAVLAVGLLLKEIDDAIKQHYNKKKQAFADQLNAEEDHVLNNYINLFVCLEEVVAEITKEAVDIRGSTEPLLKQVVDQEKKWRPHLSNKAGGHSGARLAKRLLVNGLDKYFELTLALVINVEKLAASIYPIAKASHRQLQLASQNPGSNAAAGFPEYDSMVAKGRGVVNLKMRENTFADLSKRFNVLIGKINFYIYDMDHVFNEAFNNREHYSQQWRLFQ